MKNSEKTKKHKSYKDKHRPKRTPLDENLELPEVLSDNQEDDIKEPDFEDSYRFEFIESKLISYSRYKKVKKIGL